MSRQQKARFMCFGVAGEVVIRTLVRVDKDFPPRVKIPGAPEILNRQGRPTNYVKTPAGTVIYLLTLQDEKAKTYGQWELDEVVPINESAIRLVARLKWQRQKSEFKAWRKEKGIRQPALKKHQLAIKIIKLK